MTTTAKTPTVTQTPIEARNQIVSMVRDFVRREVEPAAADHELDLGVAARELREQGGRRTALRHRDRRAAAGQTQTVRAGRPRSLRRALLESRQAQRRAERGRPATGAADAAGSPPR